MKWVLISILAATGISLPVQAGPWPEFPAQGRLITIEEVKDYWFQHLRRPVRPRSLAKNYKQKLSNYHQAVHDGRSMIRSMRAGAYNEDATLVVLRHNRDIYLQQENHAKAAELSRQITAILEARTAAIALKRAQEPPLAAVSSPAPYCPDDDDEETVYVEADPEPPYCPPPESPRPKPLPLPCPPVVVPQCPIVPDQPTRTSRP